MTSEHAARAARAQAAAAAVVNERAAGAERRPSADEQAREGTYAGLITRALAYLIDIGIINVVAIVTGAAAALMLSVFHLQKLEGPVKLVLAGAYVLFAIGYFVVFWSAPAGQTPGARAMCIRVKASRDDERLKPRRALLRVIGLFLATIPLFAGFLIMLWTPRRRCLQDYLARTVVVHAPPQIRVVRRPLQPD